MDYEKIQKPSQGGGFSPGKLRSKFLGMEKKRKEQEDLESESLRSEISEIEDRGVISSENCKDVAECSNSMATETLNWETIPWNCILKDRNYTIRSLKDGYDSANNGSSVSSAFEFQKEERASHRLLVTPFFKPAPSKWDDAQKWIGKPTSNRPNTRPSQMRVGQALASRKTAFDQRVVGTEEVDVKRIDPRQTNMEVGVQKSVNWVPNLHPVAESYTKPALIIENIVADSAVSLSRHDSSVSAQSAATLAPPPSTVRPVSVRDMGTEMTPIVSQEPSRNGTPVSGTTPMRSPTSSRPSTPGRPAPNSSPVEPANYQVDPNRELSEKELKLKTRREIMVLGAQLGKMNIAAWASKEEEDKDASTLLKIVDVSQPAKTVIETRASAWEETEKAKFMARYKSEEIKIQAWENHQKAKTEAEMRKIEVEVERMRGHAQDRLMNKLAVSRHKAEKKRAIADAKRNRYAARTEHQADYIRKTSRIPSSFSYWNWCFGDLSV
ncbi:uncharacterized protein LOC143864236 [Tasmannia lanceolata]|uniref:uncharacterized protein LOC143864236 n=1 Tax=Tasmannia lanceolata TaxID=3420 RepID=UPI004063727E